MKITVNGKEEAILTREELEAVINCETRVDCEGCRAEHGICMTDEETLFEELAKGLLAALDEIERLKAELAAAEVGHETTKRVLIGNIDDFGAISQCEKCYKMLDVFMKFCPNCGRKIEGDKA